MIGSMICSKRSANFREEIRGTFYTFFLSPPSAVWIKTSIPENTKKEQPKRPCGAVCRGWPPGTDEAGQIEVRSLEALLKATEVAALTGSSIRWVQKRARDGCYPEVQVHTNAQNRPEYLIPLSALPEQAQKKYIDQHRPAAEPAKHGGKKKGTAARPLESYSGEERAEISYWLTLVDRWQQYRRKAGGRKAECDEAFVRLTYLEDPLKRQVSVETLYRKWAAIRAETWTPWWTSAARPARVRPYCRRRSSRSS